MNFTPEGRALIADFMKTLHHSKYPQPVVAKAVGATLADLNTWRKRRYLAVSGWEYDGRVTYTGAGLLSAGLMNAAAWHFGPVAAEEIVTNHTNFIHRLDADEALEFTSYAIYSTPGLNATLEDEARPDRARYLSGTLDQLQKRDMTQGPIVIIPIGALIAQWALHAMFEMEKAA